MKLRQSSSSIRDFRLQDHYVFSFVLAFVFLIEGALDFRRIGVAQTAASGWTTFWMVAAIAAASLPLLGTSCTYSRGILSLLIACCIFRLVAMTKLFSSEAIVVRYFCAASALLSVVLAVTAGLKGFRGR